MYVCTKMKIGGASAVDASILVLTARYAVGIAAAAILWVHGQLDGVSDQCSLC
jgi:hypothetical protein